MAIKVSKARQRSSTPQPRSAAADAQSLLSLAWPLEHLLQLQAELLRATAPSVTDWLERRREATTAVLRACEKLAACRDLGGVLAIQSEWIEGAMARLDQDARAVTEHALAVSHCTVGAARHAAQTTTEMATRGAEMAMRATESESELHDGDEVIAGSAAVIRSNVTDVPTAAKAAA